MKVEEAMQVLKDAGYYVENLWCIHDVDDDRLTKENKLKVLHSAIHRENIYSMINENIADELLILNESKMKSIEEEAQEYRKNSMTKMFLEERAFIAGAYSKWVKIQIIEAKIEGLQLASQDAMGIVHRIMELDQKLKELQDESNTRV